MQKRLIGILLALAMVATFALVARGAAGENTELAAEVVRLVNVERAKAGLPALSDGNSKLNQAAQKRAEEIVGKFSHTRPNGGKFSSVLGDYGVSWTACGENIAYGQPTPQAVMDAWMDSEGHRGNILDEKGYGFNQIGIGVLQSGTVYYWVQLFIKTSTVPDKTDPPATTTAVPPPTTTKAPATTTKAPETTTKAPETTTKAPETTTQTQPSESPGFWCRLWSALLRFLRMIFFFL